MRVQRRENLIDVFDSEGHYQIKLTGVFTSYDFKGVLKSENAEYRFWGEKSKAPKNEINVAFRKLPSDQSNAPSVSELDEIRNLIHEALFAKWPQWRELDPSLVYDFRGVG